MKKPKKSPPPKPITRKCIKRMSGKFFSCLMYTLLATSTIFQVTTTAQITGTSNLTPREIAKQSLPSVVLLIMKNSRDETAKTGSGFFVASDIVATNLHVIKDCDEGVVKIVGQETLYEILGVIGIDEKNDLALLKVARIKGKALTLNSDDSTAIGDEVFAVGNPQGLEGTFSQGIVSSLRKSSKRDFIQITAPISEGSSGGAVLNNRGEVVGVAVGAIESGQSLNFAIPVSYLRSLISHQTPLIAIKNINTVAEKGLQRKAILQPNKPSAIKTDNEKCLEKFKRPQGEFDEETLFGSVRSVKEFAYIPEKKFDEWVLGDAVSAQLHRYHSNGYIEYSDAAIYSEKGATFYFNPGLFLLATREKTFPIFGKNFYYYDRANNRITEEMYLKCASCPSFELDNKIVIKCGNNTESRFDPDGKMFMKTVTQKGAAGKTTESQYNADGTLRRKDVYYKDKTGEVKEVWEPSKTNKGLLLLLSKTITTESGGQLKEIYTCIKQKGSVCNIIWIFDKSTKLILRLEYDNEVFKYDYEFDRIGNWTKRTESQQVKKFGGTYFEPIKIRTREITYY